MDLERLSTDNATHTLTDYILEAWNNKMHAAGICCDLAKASDSMNCDVLL
jgi:hypothetical protein